ncbi:bifunctional (p)ppGpp synthetase/guanosine-3',5'-bis(diphosphate) 3'-pyrophosphohydrolase [Desulfococcus sp.]|uniref:RelA/SpoT family protein n=1 Tax=Desulfococcus sp. TaxID=2025834 RepID=UPI0035936A0C
MVRISDIIDKMIEVNPDADIDLIDRAYIYSARVHDGQVRLSGEPYLSHPLEVSAILADMNLDAVSIAAGLLHDVVEDTHATLDEISEIFGPDVAHIVSGVTKLSKVETHSAHQRHADSIRKMILAMADDIRVILIKLADRLHNMRTLGFHKNDKKKRDISQETMDIYASIASRLGIYWMKRELEDTSFMFIMPEEYNRIKGLVSKDREEREHYIETVMGLIRKEMDEAGIPCEVLGRYKHFYSIYQKMITQNLEFEDVYDIVAFRIILETKSQCYEALGILHALWKPIDIKFKDYIGRPKPNMYQSLHTTVIGPYGERVEIQIRTREMDRVAKSGIAAHWSYKEGKNPDKSISEKFAWIQNLIENQANIDNPDEFMESVRIDLFPDEVYVFTPQGQVRSLVKGATPVDFAYLIHTEVGNQCVGAKVNGRMVPLRYELNTGDIVEITTNKNHQPSKDWLSFVRTVKARSRIRQWIKTQEKERSISLGREMCEKAFRKHKLNYNDVIKSEEMETVIVDFGFKALEDLIANVGYGKITPLQVVRKFIRKPLDEEESDESLLDRIIHRVRKKKPKTGGVTVKGIDDVLVRFGKCCQPVPGDSVVGYITQGRGVTVHRVNCVNALQVNPDRQIEVEWNDASGGETYPVKIHIQSFDRVGLLADLASNISKNGANILNVHSETRENQTVDSIFTLAIKDMNHLNRVLSDIKKVKQITRVERIEG